MALIARGGGRDFITLPNINKHISGIIITS
jgi:hypothetical protein